VAHNKSDEVPPPKSDPVLGAAGPLVASAVNPRYFTVVSNSARDGAAVYLTGSHLNNNFHDGMGLGADCAENSEQFDFDAYLEFLKDHDLNFIRLWRWEHFRSQLGPVHICMTPQPWPRTGPGTASDGKPKFDLSKFDDGHFGRLRDRVAAAGKMGIYVDVMLFDGFGLHLTAPPDNIEGHPFHAANNVNGLGITSIVDYQVLPLDPGIQALQEAYIRKVVDTVHDLPNVLYEVANESSGDTADSVELPDGTVIHTRIGDSTEWQYWVIGFVKQYEQQMGYDVHPIGMSMQYPVADQRKVNDVLFNSQADWISPGFDEPAAKVKSGEGPPPGRWLTDPPANDGIKVILSDTDHYSPMQSDALWAWKSFLRGHNPILYDLGIMNGFNASDESAGGPSYESLEPARVALGNTAGFARRMNLIEMEPRGDLSSTAYALANPGEEYLILQPSEKAEAFTVTLEAGTYAVEWFDVNSRETLRADNVTIKGPSANSFSAPFKQPGSAVLYLKRA
jgi:hypothetical protein